VGSLSLTQGGEGEKAVLFCAGGCLKLSFSSPEKKGKKEEGFSIFLLLFLKKKEGLESSFYLFFRGGFSTFYHG